MLSGARRASSARLFSRPSSRARALQRPPPAASSGSAGCSPPTPRRHAPGRTLLPQGCAGNMKKPRESLPLALPPLSLQDRFKSPEPVKSLVTSQSSSLTLRKPGGPRTAGRKDSRAGLLGGAAASVRVCLTSFAKKKKRRKNVLIPALFFLNSTTGF